MCRDIRALGCIVRLRVTCIRARHYVQRLLDTRLAVISPRVDTVVTVRSEIFAGATVVLGKTIRERVERWFSFPDPKIAEAETDADKLEI